MPGFDRTDDGPLAVLTLDHGDLNLFDHGVFESLIAEVDALAAAPPRALLVQASGRVVSAGVDVHEFEGLTPRDASLLWQRLIRAVQALEDLPCPTVFAAHGLCLTAAFEIALACDLLVAATSARFGLVETVVGLTPSMGGPQRLTERAGPARARQLVYTGELFTAESLAQWGVVTQMLPDDTFTDDAREVARKLAHGPTLAHAATKRLVRTAADHGVRAADALVPGVSSPLFDTEDLRGAVAAFLKDGPGRATYSGR
jgi:enoyl-CoA hydratase